jgi:hypothetical protein
MQVLIADSGYDVAVTRLDRLFNGPGTQGGQDAAAAIAAATGQDPTNEFPWLSRGSPLSISAGISTATPILLADNYRNFILVQNNSVASATGDIAPNLYLAVDGPVQLITIVNPVTSTPFSIPLNAITFAPGVGLLLDERVLTNSLYVAWGTSVNTGGSVYTNGFVLYGRTPNSPPLPSGPVSANNRLGLTGGTAMQAGLGDNARRDAYGNLYLQQPDGSWQLSPG